MPLIQITVGSITIRAETFDTPTVAAVIAACPITVRANTWGDEVYFSTPVSVAREADAKAVIEAGELAYWPDGDAIAIGYGPTPISQSGEIRLASLCNIWARALDDVTALSPAPDGAPVRVSLVE